MKKTIVVLFLAFAGLAFGGCGYHRARLDNPLLSGYQTIAIPYFKNKTFEPGAEKIFTDAFMREFIESRRFKIVSEHEADVILYGTVKNLKEESVAQNRNDKTLEYLLYMTLDLRLEERATGKVLWKRKGMRHVEDYPIYENDIQLSETAKRASLKKIAADLAERSHDSIMMGF